MLENHERKKMTVCLYVPWGASPGVEASGGQWSLLPFKLPYPDMYIWLDTLRTHWNRGFWVFFRSEEISLADLWWHYSTAAANSVASYIKTLENSFTATSLMRLWFCLVLILVSNVTPPCFGHTGGTWNTAPLLWCWCQCLLWKHEVLPISFNFTGLLTVPYCYWCN